MTAEHKILIAPASEFDTRAPGAFRALCTILQVWRPFYGRLGGGLLLSALALLSGLALMWAAGASVSAFALGSVATYGVLRLFGGGRIFLRYAERLFSHDAMFRALAALRLWFFRHLAAGAAAGLGFRRAGDLLNRLVGDIECLDTLYLRIAVPILGAVLSLPVMTIVAWCFDWRLGLGLGLLFVLAAGVLPAISAQRAARRSHILSHTESSLRIAALDLATGLREARAFLGEGRLIDRIAREEALLHGAQRVQGRAIAGAGALSYLCGQAALILILLALSRRDEFTLSFPSAVALIFLTGAVFEAVTTLARTGVLTSKVMHAAQRVVAIAEDDHPQSDAHYAIAKGGDIALRDVTFRWDKARAPVLRSITLTVRAGEHVALIGPSGAGKSSLAALLLKVEAPESGEILMDGCPLTTLDTASVRRQIGWLSQATHLFADTIRNNLTLGQNDIAEERLWAALEQAEIAETVRALPEGLECWIGEGGARLSGGQGRRLALARTLLQEAPILVLDEPATGLDSATERAFLETLNRTTKGRSVILIAHRLTGVEKLDRVWRLEDGEARPVVL